MIPGPCLIPAIVWASFSEAECGYRSRKHFTHFVFTASSHTSQAAHQRCSEEFLTPSGWARGRFKIEEICSPCGWINDMNQSYVSFVQRTNHNTAVSDSLGNGPIIYVHFAQGVWTKSPATSNASQARSWARTLQWSHPGDTVQWFKQILLALQLLQLWDRWTNISEYEGKNSLIRRLKTTKRHCSKRLWTSSRGDPRTVWRFGCSKEVCMPWLHACVILNRLSSINYISTQIVCGPTENETEAKATTYICIP